MALSCNLFKPHHACLVVVGAWRASGNRFPAGTQDATPSPHQGLMGLCCCCCYQLKALAPEAMYNYTDNTFHPTYLGSTYLLLCSCSREAQQKLEATYLLCRHVLREKLLEIKVAWY